MNNLAEWNYYQGHEQEQLPDDARFKYVYDKHENAFVIVFDKGVTDDEVEAYARLHFHSDYKITSIIRTIGCAIVRHKSVGFGGRQR